MVHSGQGLLRPGCPRPLRKRARAARRGSTRYTTQPALGPRPPCLSLCHVTASPPRFIGHLSRAGPIRFSPRTSVVWAWSPSGRRRGWRLSSVRTRPGPGKTEGSPAKPRAGGLAAEAATWEGEETGSGGQRGRDGRPCAP